MTTPQSLRQHLEKALGVTTRARDAVLRSLRQEARDTHNDDIAAIADKLYQHTKREQQEGALTESFTMEAIPGLLPPNLYAQVESFYQNQGFKCIKAYPALGIFGFHKDNTTHFVNITEQMTGLGDMYCISVNDLTPRR